MKNWRKCQIFQAVVVVVVLNVFFFPDDSVGFCRVFVQCLPAFG